MPRMIALKCPNCNGPLEVPDDRERFYCQFCGSPVVRPEAAGGEEAGRDFPSPRDPGVRVAIPDKLQIQDFGDELTISYRWFHWSVLFLIPFCIAWNAFLVGWYALAGQMQGMPGAMRIVFLVFPIGHVAVGLGLIYAVLTMLFNRTTIRVRHGELGIRHGPIFFPGNRTVSIDDLDQLYCRHETRRTSKGGSQTTHSLHARLKNGTAVKLLSHTADEDVLRAVEHLIEQHLGIEDKPVQ
jgi:hypothetical protein